MDGPADEALAAIERQEALTRGFLKDIRALGYHAFDAFSLDPETLNSPVREGNWAITSYDLGFVRDYLAEGMAAICPALTEASRSLTPFDYVALLDSCRGNASARWQKRALRLFGIRHAWLVPMNSLRCLRGVTVYMKGGGAKAAQRFEETRQEIHMKSLYFFDELQALSPSIPPDMARTLSRMGPLTRREAECLRWAAEGKTNWEIATILDISENTVRFHFKNLLRRLNATSRAQAVALFRSNAISPPEDGTGPPATH